VRRRLGDHRARRTLDECLIEKAMPVGGLTLKRDEEIAGAYLARVKGDALDFERGGGHPADRRCNRV
jgi:hypothetical protein